MNYFECQRCKKLTPFTAEQKAVKGKHAAFKSPAVVCKRMFCWAQLQRSAHEMNDLRLASLSKKDAWDFANATIKERYAAERA